jgi:hypothetical protein
VPFKPDDARFACEDLKAWTSCVVPINKIITQEAKTSRSTGMRTLIDIDIKGLEGRVIVICSHHAYQILENMKNFPNGMAKYNCRFSKIKTFRK